VIFVAYIYVCLCVIKMSFYIPLVCDLGGICMFMRCARDRRVVFVLCVRLCVCLQCVSAVCVWLCTHHVCDLCGMYLYIDIPCVWCDLTV